MLPSLAFGMVELMVDVLGGGLPPFRRNLIVVCVLFVLIFFCFCFCCWCVSFPSQVASSALSVMTDWATDMSNPTQPSGLRMFAYKNVLIFFFLIFVVFWFLLMFLCTFSQMILNPKFPNHLSRFSTLR